MIDIRGAGPGEPPPGVTSEVLWRLAARLFRDHQGDDRGEPDSDRGDTGDAAAVPVLCRGCEQPWPCSGRRLAVLGLDRASAGAAG